MLTDTMTAHSQQPSQLARQHLQRLLDSLQQQGFETTSVLRHCGLSRGLRNSTAVTPMMLQCAIAYAVSNADEPLLGLLHGARLPLTMRSFASQVYLAAASFAEALSWLIRYLNNDSLLAQLRVRQQHPLISVEAVSNCNSASLANFSQHSLLATVSALLHYLTSQSGSLTGVVRLCGSPVGPGLRYEEPLLFPVQFNQNHNALCLPNSVLNIPMASLNLPARRQAEVECEQQLASMPQQLDLATRIRCQLLQQCQFPNLAQIAEQLNVSARTINRHMAELNTSYQELLESARRQLAIHYLLTSSLSIDDIAGQLGYQDASNFGRAFRRWLGLSPRRFRQSQPYTG